MGEVTNVYPILVNKTPGALTQVCATLSASDEARVHPDRTVCVGSLPPGFQITIKLTADTSFNQDTSIQDDVSTLEGLEGSISAPSCLDLGFPGWIPSEVGLVKPIP